jgi:NADP-dependent 3-hydroxy acid dehydrogenase YdfG
MNIAENMARTALITGGCSGIGLAIAKKMANEGLLVIIADIKPPKETISGNIHYIQCDISSGSNVDSLYGQISNSFRLPDILVCNAGRGIHERLAEGDPEKWKIAFDVNVMGTLRCIRSFVPDMIKNKNGDVVFISSVSANQPYEYGGIYAATKSSLEVIAETLRIETLPDLRVTIIAPGTTKTGFFTNLISGYQSVDDMGFEAISPNDIAESVWYAIDKPKGISINKIIVRPTGQIF